MLLTRLFRGRCRPAGRLVHPRGWPRRHWLVSSAALAAITLVAASLTAWLYKPPAPCGGGLTQVDQVCVGLDLDSTGFAAKGPLTDLARRVARSNQEAGDKHVTIVLLDNMTPDPEQDSDDIRPLLHRVQGALTAVRRANTQAVAGTAPKIKLLLASYGSGARAWEQAVEAIKGARESQRIVAVTGIGQSLENTRQAVAELSDAGIATVGSVVTADDMNKDLNNEHIDNFVRVAPRNTDEAHAIVSYLQQRPYRKPVLVHDRNEDDSYARTLTSAFLNDYRKRTGIELEDEPYTSPRQHLKGAKREEHMAHWFSINMRSSICDKNPDVVVFAGRSADLVAFMRAMAEGGACGIDSLDVVTGDDASNIAGKPLPESGHLTFNVFYTALAHGAQWDKTLRDSVNRKNYNEFAQVFLDNGFGSDDLADGHAMMSHDAALTAIMAVRDNPEAARNPSSVRHYLAGYGCTRPVPGASGEIGLDPHGNPINKAMPIVQIRGNGSLAQEDLVFPAGHPLDPTAPACGS